MDTLEQHNLREIEGLNQRGGRTLSWVDLIAAGTMSAEMVAHCWTAIAHGASFLTAARPGGAGKSTVLANLLGLLPPGEQVITWSLHAREEQLRRQVELWVAQGKSRSEVFRALNELLQDEFLVSSPHSAEVTPPEPTCWLAHEIGAGHWYGYIWGSEVPVFLHRQAQGQRIASCLHADTLEETRHTLFRPPLHVSEEAFDSLGLLLYIHLLPERRVALLYEATAEGPRLAFSLDADGSPVRHGPSQLPALPAGSETEYERRLETVREIVARGEREFERVRQQVAAAYEG